MAKSTSSISGLEYLLKPTDFAPKPVCVVYGDEGFLKQEVISGLRRQALGDGEDEFSVTSLIGNEAEWKDVVDALSTVSLFGDGQRLTIVREASGKPGKAKKDDNADGDKSNESKEDDEDESKEPGDSGFISRCRDQLEHWVGKPVAGSVLILDATTWPGTTRLAKAVAAKGLAIDCRVPEKGAELNSFVNQAKKWLIARAKSVHGAPLEPAAADMLFNLLPLSLGIIDQEVAKLALYVQPGSKIDKELVSQHVGDWRTRTTWDMIDAMAEGRAAEALRQLHLLMLAGDVPVALFGQIGYSLRNIAAAASLVAQAEARGQRLSLTTAFKEAGAKWQFEKLERQLKQIGRERAQKLNEWMMDVDLALKGHNSSGLGARLELERLIVRLSTAANAQ
jgi:DNA polymerase-3 subunit delta